MSIPGLPREGMTRAQVEALIDERGGGGTALPDQTGQSGKFLSTNGSTAAWTALEGGGDMAAAVYDPQEIGGDAFSMANMTEGTTAKIMTATERTKLAGIATGATANSDDATLLARANHTGTQSADTITDGTTNKVFTATEKTKLSGIATGATANATDAQLRDRSTHTGTQAISTVTGLQTALDAKSATSHTHDAVYAALSHTHDDRYYTESEVDALIAGIEPGEGGGAAATPWRMIVGADVAAADTALAAAAYAVCDGTDDHVQIQAALDEGPGSVLLVGEFFAETTIDLGDDRTLYGLDWARSILNFGGEASDSDSDAVRMSGENVTVRDLRVNLTGGDYEHGVRPWKAGATILRVKVVVSGSSLAGSSQLSCISPTTNINGSITDCYIGYCDVSGSGAPRIAGIVMHDSPGGIIEHNTIHDITMSSTSGSDKAHTWGIYIASDSTGAVARFNRVMRTNGSGIHVNPDGNDRADAVGYKVLHNEIEDVAYTGIAIENCTDPECSHNSVTLANAHLRLGTSANTSEGSGWIDGGTAIGNRVAVARTADYNDSNIMVFVGGDRVILDDTTIGDRGTFTAVVNVGIQVDGKHCRVSNTTFNTKRPARGILALSGDGCVVSKAYIPTTDQSTSTGSHYTVQLSANRCALTESTLISQSGRTNVNINGDNCRVALNDFQGGDRNMNINSGADGTIVLGNQFSGAVNATAVNNAGTNTSATGNVGWTPA